MSNINFKDYIGKTISKEALINFDFYHYVDGECKEYVKDMKKDNKHYDESLIKEELPEDCWLTRKYVPEGCCIQANGVLIFELDDNNKIKKISYMVEYVHNPGDPVPYMELEDNVGNWYGFQGLSSPYMIEDYFEEIMSFDK